MWHNLSNFGVLLIFKGWTQCLDWGEVHSSMYIYCVYSPTINKQLSVLGGGDAPNWEQLMAAGPNIFPLISNRWHSLRPALGGEIPEIEKSGELLTYLIECFSHAPKTMNLESHPPTLTQWAVYSDFIGQSNVDIWPVAPADIWLYNLEKFNPASERLWCIWLSSECFINPVQLMQGSEPNILHFALFAAKPLVCAWRYCCVHKSTLHIVQTTYCCKAACRFFSGETWNLFQDWQPDSLWLWKTNSQNSVDSWVDYWVDRLCLWKRSHFVSGCDSMHWITR